MRDIEFRGKRTDNGEFVYGFVCKDTIVGDTDCKVKYVIRTNTDEPYADNWYLVAPETIGQFTGMTEFVVADSNIHGKLFEGDIVEVWAHRRPKWDNPRSRYDGDVKIRGVIKFQNSQWWLDFDNLYNRGLEKLKGKEIEERTVDNWNGLHHYGCSPEREKWEREQNVHYKWNDIVKIGNIYDNPELLEE